MPKRDSICGGLHRAKIAPLEVETELLLPKMRSCRRCYNIEASATSRPLRWSRLSPRPAESWLIPSPPGSTPLPNAKPSRLGWRRIGPRIRPARDSQSRRQAPISPVDLRPPPLVRQVWHVRARLPPLSPIGATPGRARTAACCRRGPGVERHRAPRSLRRRAAVPMQVEEPFEGSSSMWWVALPAMLWSSALMLTAPKSLRVRRFSRIVYI